MCGICGVVALDGRLAPRLVGALPAMTEALRHRGPDAAGAFNDDVVALGHRRLAIIDRAGGTQPLANEDGSYWIVFNGEIYNYRELRENLLARGYRFRTASDTETILHGYEEYGPGVVDRLEGMFAFAVYDVQARAVFIARDRLGKKPLFYTVAGGALLFASEVRSLRCSPAWDGTLDPGALEEYLSLGYIIAPRTIYRHVRKLEPGHWLRVAGGRVETRQYWDIPAFDEPVDASVAGEQLEALLRSAVRMRLESEVPLGAFLSGGVDSGLVVSFMAEALGRDVATMSVGFGSAGHNELVPAALTASRCGTRHFAELIEPRLDEVLDRVAGAFDEPFADSSAIPTFYLSAMARRHVTVVLSGDGGDEVFGGYSNRYLPHVAESITRRVVGPLGCRALGALGAWWPRHLRLPRAFRIGTLLENVARDAAAAYYFDLCFMKPNAARALVGLPAVADLSLTQPYEAVTEPYRRCPSKSVLQRAMYADLKIHLPNDMLVKVDRMSMQHGLEVRCPLLDHRLVEFGFRTPIGVKMRNLRPKHLLRTIAATRLPASVLRLPKRGFTAPAGEWITGPYAETFRADVFDSRSAVSRLLDLALVERMLAEHRRGARNHTFGLWAVWMLERWSRLATADVAAAVDPSAGDP